MMKDGQQGRKILMIRTMKKNGKDNDNNGDCSHQLSSYIFKCKELSPTNLVLCLWTITVSGDLLYLSPILLVQVT